MRQENDFAMWRGRLKIVEFNFFKSYSKLCMITDEHLKTADTFLSVVVKRRICSRTGVSVVGAPPGGVQGPARPPRHGQRGRQVGPQPEVRPPPHSRYHTQRARAPITNQCNGKLLKVKIIFLLARRSIILQISFKFWSSSLKS